MSVMTLSLGGGNFKAFVSGFIVCLSVVGGKILVKHVADKLLSKNFSFGSEKDFFIWSPISLANNCQIVFWAEYAKSPDFLK